MGNQKSLDEECAFAHSCTQDEFDAYMESLTPEERELSIKRAIGVSWLQGEHAKAISLYKGMEKLKQLKGGHL